MVWKLEQELLFYKGQELAGLEPKRPGALHWRSDGVPHTSAEPIGHQVILQGVGPKFSSDNFSNRVEFKKAVV